MSFLHLNGWDIPLVSCELSQRAIAAFRGYSPNGVYQMQRNSFARVWVARTSLLTSAQRDALLEMLGHRGDSYRWDLAGNPAGYVYVGDASVAEVYSDKFRPPQAVEAVATIHSTYAADGARVYLANNAPVGPMAGCSGSVAVEPGTVNLLSASEAHPTANGHLTNIASGSHAAESDRYWTGAGSVTVTCTASNDGVEANGTGVIGQIYQLSVYVRGSAGGEQIVLQHRNAAGAIIASQAYTLPSELDKWTRYKVSGTQITDTTVRLFILSANGAMQFSVDGLQVEQQNARVTSWVDPAQDFWGSGNGVRDAGVLDYDTWLASYTSGVTLASWINLHTLIGAAQTLIQTGATGARANLVINNLEQPYFSAISSDDSLQRPTGTALSLGLHFIVGVHDPTANASYLYVDGALVDTDSTWSAARQYWDAKTHAGDLSVGSNGTPGSTCPAAILGPTMVLPYVLPASVIGGLYAAAVDDRAAPGVIPIGAHGTFLQDGDKRVDVYSQVDATPHEPWFNGATWELRGGRIAFTLFEAEKR